jgi:hypothetical protein
LAHQLNFRTTHQYDTLENGITLEVILRAGGKVQRTSAKLDTGASHCFFQREYAEALGIDLASGERISVHTATGSFLAYGHQITLEVLGLLFDTAVYFANDYGFPRNVLGRKGWLDRVRLGLVDYEGQLYLSDYNDL